MNNQQRKIFLFIFFLSISYVSFSQVIRKPVYRKSHFQFSLVPGLGTNGIHSGEYINRLSLNLFSGYSAGNKGLEIAGLSNSNVTHVSGIQIGGLSNIVGGNIFVGLTPSERMRLRKFGIEANLTGFQFSGLFNYVTGEVEGGQTSGGVNITEKALTGFQIAGISNIVYKFTLGFQIAGISNASYQSIDGFQISSLYNYTRGELFGLQLGAFNQAGNIEGIYSVPSSKITGFQIGLINTANKMNGYQIGLINYGGVVEGTQIGLLNFSKSNEGTPFGLMNVTTKGGHVRAYFSEIFLTNFEISTGTENVQNLLTLHYNFGNFYNLGELKWGFGYGIAKVAYSRNKGKFFNYDINFSHLNPGEKLQKRLSLLTRLRGTFGVKIPPKPKLISYLFGGITLNTFFSDYNFEIAPEAVQIFYKQFKKFNLEFWPGIILGVHLY